MAGKKTTRKAAGDVQKEVSFEQAMTRLEEIVETLESGDASLEASLALFEEGVVLSRRCNQRLDAAERRLEVLAGNGTAPEDVTALDEDEFRLSSDEDESE